MALLLHSLHSGFLFGIAWRRTKLSLQRRRNTLFALGESFSALKIAMSQRFALTSILTPAARSCVYHSSRFKLVRCKSSYQVQKPQSCNGYGKLAPLRVGCASLLRHRLHFCYRIKLSLQPTKAFLSIHLIDVLSLAHLFIHRVDPATRPTIEWQHAAPMLCPRSHRNRCCRCPRRRAGKTDSLHHFGNRPQEESRLTIASIKLNPSGTTLCVLALKLPR